MSYFSTAANELRDLFFKYNSAAEGSFEKDSLKDQLQMKLSEINKELGDTDKYDNLTHFKELSYSPVISEEDLKILKSSVDLLEKVPSLDSLDWLVAETKKLGDTAASTDTTPPSYEKSIVTVMEDYLKTIQETLDRADLPQASKDELVTRYQDGAQKQWEDFYKVLSQEGIELKADMIDAVKGVLAKSGFVSDDIEDPLWDMLGGKPVVTPVDNLAEMVEKSVVAIESADANHVDNKSADLLDLLKDHADAKVTDDQKARIDTALEKLLGDDVLELNADGKFNDPDIQGLVDKLGLDIKDPNAKTGEDDDGGLPKDYHALIQKLDDAHEDWLDAKNLGHENALAAKLANVLPVIADYVKDPGSISEADLKYLKEVLTNLDDANFSDDKIEETINKALTDLGLTPNTPDVDTSDPGYGGGNNGGDLPKDYHALIQKLDDAHEDWLDAKNLGHENALAAKLANVLPVIADYVKDPGSISEADLKYLKEVLTNLDDANFSDDKIEETINKALTDLGLTPNTPDVDTSDPGYGGGNNGGGLDDATVTTLINDLKASFSDFGSALKARDKAAGNKAEAEIKTHLDKLSLDKMSDEQKADVLKMLDGQDDTNFKNDHIEQTINDFLKGLGQSDSDISDVNSYDPWIVAAIEDLVKVISGIIDKSGTDAQKDAFSSILDTLTKLGILPEGESHGIVLDGEVQSIVMNDKLDVSALDHGAVEHIGGGIGALLKTAEAHHDTHVLAEDHTIDLTHVNGDEVLYPNDPVDHDLFGDQ